MAKLKAAFGHSVTILWARVVALAGVGLAIAAELSGDPTFSSAVQQIIPPAWVPWLAITIGLITEAARWRTASTSGDS